MCVRKKNAAGCILVINFGGALMQLGAKKLGAVRCVHPQNARNSLNSNGNLGKILAWQGQIIKYNKLGKGS